jgi:hypothetical protein
MSPRREGPVFDDMPSPRGDTFPAEAAAVPEVFRESSSVPSVSRGFSCDEEGALIYAFRLINRAASHGALTPVERAFIAGARTMLEMLGEHCKKMLEDYDETAQTLAPTEEEPRSAAPRRRKKSKTRR